LLPVSEDTLVYGSQDGCSTVHLDDLKMNNMMMNVAKMLNLKPHKVGIQRPNVEGKIVHTCADIEGHYGNDGRYYVLDCARLFPPIATSETGEYE
jgi:hypothetical protein